MSESVNPSASENVGGDPAPAAGEAPKAAAKSTGKLGPRVCNKCGVDLTKKARFGDDKGYWCPACHKKDKAEKWTNSRPCDECGKRLPKDQILDYKGERMCATCINKKELEALKKKKAEEAAKQMELEAQQRRLKVKRMAYGVVILALVALLVVILRSGKPKEAEGTDGTSTTQPEGQVGQPAQKP